eukprot:COSAG02_NODE_181_length_30783_cov_53.060520_29_plen_45_part_00
MCWCRLTVLTESVNTLAAVIRSSRALIKRAALVIAHAAQNLTDG